MAALAEVGGECDGVIPNFGVKVSSAGEVMAISVD